ncbi:MAG: hypothetical protein ACHQQQ_14220 [Bacteroidota bacterium]
MQNNSPHSKKERPMRINIIAIFFLFLSGCVSTNLSSLYNPQYSGSKFKNLMVKAKFSDIATMKSYENHFLSRADERNIPIIRESDVMPAIRDYSAAEIDSVVSLYNLDGVIEISVQASVITSQYFHLGTKPGESNTSGSVRTYGNVVYYEEHTESKPAEERGITLEKPSQYFTAKLFDAKTGDIVWVATGEAGGSILTNFDNLASHEASDVMDLLLKEQFVVPSESGVTEVKINEETDILNHTATMSYRQGNNGILYVSMKMVEASHDRRGGKFSDRLFDLKEGENVYLRSLSGDKIYQVIIVSIGNDALRLKFLK